MSRGWQQQQQSPTQCSDCQTCSNAHVCITVQKAGISLTMSSLDRNILDIQITRVKHRAECSTDHQMVWSQLCISIKPPHRLNAAKPPQKLNTTKLKHCECADALRSCMETALSWLVENPPDDITKHWNAFKEMVNNAALNTLGKVKHKHQDWFDEGNQSVQDLLWAKVTRHQAHLWHPNSTSKKMCFSECKINSAEAA